MVKSTNSDFKVITTFFRMSKFLGFLLYIMQGSFEDLLMEHPQYSCYYTYLLGEKKKKKIMKFQKLFKHLKLFFMTKTFYM